MIMPTDTVSLDVLAGQAKVQMEEQRLLRKDVAAADRKQHREIAHRVQELEDKS